MGGVAWLYVGLGSGSPPAHPARGQGTGNRRTGCLQHRTAGHDLHGASGGSLRRISLDFPHWHTALLTLISYKSLKNMHLFGEDGFIKF